MRLSEPTRRDLRLLAVAWLGVALVRALGALHWVPVPLIFSDELVYQRLALSIARGQEGDPRFVLSAFPFIAYPALLSPLYAALPVASAYAWVRVVNALVLGAGCFPVYLLGRRLLPRRWSLACAALSLLLPAQGYGATVMSECLFYPLSSLVISLAVPWMSGRARRVPLALGAAGAALMLAKVQGAFTLAALGAVALALPGLTLRERLGRAWRLGAAGALATALFGATSALRMGRLFHLTHPDAWLGPYAMVAAARVTGPGAMVWLRVFCGTLAGACAEVAPAAGMFGLAAAAAFAFGPAVRRRPRAFAGAVLALLVLHTWLAVRQTLGFDGEPRLHARYVAYLAPWLLVASAMALRAWTPRAFAATAAGATAVGVALMLWSLPNLGNWAVVTDTPALAWTRLGFETAVRARNGALGACALGALALLAAALRRPAWAGAAVGLLAAGGSVGLLLAQNVAARVKLPDRSGPLAILSARLPPGPRYYVLDGADPNGFWLDEFFRGAEETSICFRPGGIGCYLRPPGPDGTLPGLDAGALLVAPEVVAFNRAPLDREASVAAYRLEPGLRVAAVRESATRLWVPAQAREVGLLLERPDQGPVQLLLRSAGETERAVEPNQPVTVPLPPLEASGEVTVTTTPEAVVRLALPAP